MDICLTKNNDDHYAWAPNTSMPRQNGRRFAGDSFKRNFLNENIRNSFKIALKFVPKGSTNNVPVLVQVMSWCRPGDKPLSEPMMARLPTHICVARPQWVNINAEQDMSCTKWPFDIEV